MRTGTGQKFVYFGLGLYNLVNYRLGQKSVRVKIRDFVKKYEDFFAGRGCECDREGGMNAERDM